jgi:anti-sigma regulatory factor (Ser/Thr protein kinase)
MTTTDRTVIIDCPPRIAATWRRPARSAALCTARATPAVVPELRHFACHVAERWRIPADSSDALSLVVSELVTNVVLHSGSPEVSVLITFDGAATTVEVLDTGRWLDRGSQRRVAEDEEAAYGRGLELVNACTSRCAVIVTPTGTRVVAHLPVVDPIG